MPSGTVYRRLAGVLAVAFVLIAGGVPRAALAQSDAGCEARQYDARMRCGAAAMAAKQHGDAHLHFLAAYAAATTPADRAEAIAMSALNALRKGSKQEAYSSADNALQLDKTNKTAARVMAEISGKPMAPVAAQRPATPSANSSGKPPAVIAPAGEVASGDCSPGKKPYSLRMRCGLEAMREKRYEDAHGQFVTAFWNAQNDKERAEAAAQAGATFVARGLHDSAETSAIRALKLDPDNQTAADVMKQASNARTGNKSAAAAGGSDADRKSLAAVTAEIDRLQSQHGAGESSQEHHRRLVAPLEKLVTLTRTIYGDVSVEHLKALKDRSIAYHGSGHAQANNLQDFSRIKEIEKVLAARGSDTDKERSKIASQKGVLGKTGSEAERWAQTRYFEAMGVANPDKPDARDLAARVRAQRVRAESDRRGGNAWDWHTVARWLLPMAVQQYGREHQVYAEAATHRIAALRPQFADGKFSLEAQERLLSSIHAIFEKSKAIDTPYGQDIARDLGLVYVELRRFAEAEAILTHLFKSGNPQSLSGSVPADADRCNLAYLHARQKSFTRAEALLAERKSAGSASEAVRCLEAAGLTQLGLGRNEAAEKALRAAVDRIAGAGAGTSEGGKLALARVRRTLGRALMAANRLDEADAIIAAGGDQMVIAELRERQGRAKEAYEVLEKVVNSPAAQFFSKAKAAQNDTDRDSRGLDEFGIWRPQASFAEENWSLTESEAALLRVGWKLHQTASGAEQAKLATQAFKIAAAGSRGRTSIERMATRYSVRDSGVGALIRQQQDLREQHERLAREWSALQRGPAAGGGADELRRKIQDIEKSLSDRYGALEAQVVADAENVERIKELLRPEETIVLYAVAGEEVHGWVVTRQALVWRKLAYGRQQIESAVKTLRCGLDSQSWAGGGSGVTCSDFLGSPKPKDDAPLPFHFKKAHELYGVLLAPFAEHTRDKHLLVVPSGALSSLPFHVLVTAPAKVDVGRRDEDYAGVAWLARTQATSVLPSIASLQALRKFAAESRGTKAYLGIGNPQLAGDASCVAEGDLPACPKAGAPSARRSGAQRGRTTASGAAMGKILRSGGARSGTAALVRALCPLPETAVEINCVAGMFAAPADDLKLGPLATEANLSKLNASGGLSQYRVVHFATHGLLAGDVEYLSQSVGEPALVMTPPADATDDGLLTASEISRLKFNADWVILSACNTAAGQSLGAEAMSGLARSFFYAGARALLASHWPVYSEAAVLIVSRIMDEVSKSGTTRAEALRRAMVALMSDAAHADSAHPSVWAPFVVIGEGAAVR